MSLLVRLLLILAAPITALFVARDSQHFDVIHIQSPNVEPQDVPLNLRHLRTTESQLTLSTKPLFVFSRGTPQVRDSMEMVRGRERRHRPTGPRRARRAVTCPLPDGTRRSETDRYAPAP